ncbi:MAG TPA: DUF5723 family protein [Bacteroidales bacterium]|nr:DUF5723 family protein [Bacteroidales bacterium]HSA42773.1 DUF5723 family protein [Bacteroidales bacterium]
MNRTCHRILSHFCCLVFLSYCGGPARSQEMTGLTTSNYSGINTLMLNPALMINSRLYCDIHLLSGGAFFENNYMYLADGEYAFSDLFKKEYQLVDYGMSPDKLTLYDYYGGNFDDVLKKVFLNTRINGPGLMFSYQDHAFALTTSFRNMLSIKDVPFHVAKFCYEGIDWPLQQDIRYQTGAFDMAQMSWAEVGFSYAYRFAYTPESQMSAGITIKKVLGFTAVYLDCRNADYMVPDDSTLIVYNIDAEAGISVPIDRDTNQVSIAENIFRGRGWGFDLGFVYQKNAQLTQKGRIKDNPTLCGQSFTEYDYKFGISLLDFGSVEFTQQADKWVFDNVSTFWPGIDKTNYRTIAEAAGDLGYRFYSDSLAARQDNRFRMFLPAALSLQFDYHLQQGFYIHSLLIQSLRTRMPGLWRPSQLAVVPRFESRYVDAFLPLSFYDWRYTRLGFALRLAFLTIGTDRLGAFMGLKDFTGADAYFALKFNLNKGYCKKKKQVRRCRNAEYQRYLR